MKQLVSILIGEYNFIIYDNGGALLIRCNNQGTDINSIIVALNDIMNGRWNTKSKYACTCVGCSFLFDHLDSYKKAIKRFNELRHFI